MLRHSFALAVGLLLFLLATTHAEDWPGFRGPTGMGITTEKNLPLTWGVKEKENLLWQVPLPGNAAGMKRDHSQSSPIVWQDRVFVTTAFWPAGQDQGTIPEQHVTCFALADGKQLWDTVVPPGPWKLSDLRGGYAAPTPCTDGQRIYALFGSSILAALDFKGKVVWSQEVPDWKDFDVCIASSPVLFAGKLYLLADRNGNNKSLISALDPATGAVLWEQKRPGGFSHTTPVFIRHQERGQLLIGGAKTLESLDPANGERLWSCATSGDVTAPVYGGGLVYTDSGRGGPGVAVDPSGTGDVSKTHVRWTSDTLPEGLSSPVIAGELLYRLHNPGVLRCVEMKSGETLFKERLEGISVSSSPLVTPDGRVYLASAGKTIVIAAGREFKILATNDLGEPHASSAAVAPGKLILKGSQHLFCVGGG